MPAVGRIGDCASAPVDAHGCPACPHPVQGPGVSGSPNVSANGRPVIRVGDTGIHMTCCFTNGWEAAAGSATVFVNGKPIHRLGDAVKHCGGVGTLIDGSPDVSAQ